MLARTILMYAFLSLVPIADCAGETGAARFVDLSVLVAPHLPCTGPAAWWPIFQINHYIRIGPLSAYNSDVLIIDGNTGTQLDVPPHSIPRPGLDAIDDQNI